MKDNDKVIITVRDNFSYTVRRFLQRMAYRLFGPVIMAKVYYKIVMKKSDIVHEGTASDVDYGNWLMMKVNRETYDKKQGNC